MKKAILKYGVFVILLVMSLGLLIILNQFEIRSKTSVYLIVSENQGCMAYVAYDKKFDPNIGDTIKIDQTLGDEVAFIVKAVKKEPSNLVLQLYPIDKEMNVIRKFGGNTFSPGYIYTGRIKLRDLVFKQIRM